MALDTLSPRDRDSHATTYRVLRAQAVAAGDHTPQSFDAACFVPKIYAGETAPRGPSCPAEWVAAAEAEIGALIDQMHWNRMPDFETRMPAHLFW